MHIYSDFDQRLINLCRWRMERFIDGACRLLVDGDDGN
jgi:hypothetical protein